MPPICKKGDECPFYKKGKCNFFHPEKQQVFKQQKVPKCHFGRNCKNIFGCKYSHTQEELEQAETEKVLKSWVQYYENYCNSVQFVTVQQFANLAAPFENMAPSEIAELVQVGIKVSMPDPDCDLEEESDEDKNEDEACETFSDF